uniref:Ladinin 1 n=1 Tax=Sarcophilus harrisii TaxID=9305 RepID=A0A7N4P4V0_SARHA
MSIKRKNWSALSSLARQRTLEDEEEQERERRRRHRNLSSTTDDEAPKVAHNGDQPTVERLPSLEESEVPKRHSSIKDEEDENFQAVLRTRQERRLRRQAMEASQSSIKEQLEVEKKKDSQNTEPATQEPSVPQKDMVPPPRRRLSEKQRGPWAIDEKSSEGGETKTVKALDQKTVSTPEKTPAQDQTAPERKRSTEKMPAPNQATPEKTFTSEKIPAQDQTDPERKKSTEKMLAPNQATPEKTFTSEKIPAQDQTAPERKRASEKTLPQDQTTPEKKLTSEKRSAFEKASFTEKTLVPEEALAPKKVLAGEKALTSVKTSSLEKVLVSEKGSVSEESLIPKKLSTRERALVFERTSAQEKALIPEKGSVREKVIASRKLGLEQPPVQTPEQKDSEKDVTEKKEPKRRETLEKSPSSEAPREEMKSEPQPVASRFRPFTLQMSTRKENPETTFTRSASVRLPSNTVKLGEKLERYHTAIQRSASVKSPGSSRTEFFVAPVGVASKRSLFEKEQVRNSKAEPALSRKEYLRLSDVKTSRLNLWISRTQDSGGDQDSQDIKKEAVTTKKNSWGKQATSPPDSQI